MAEQLFQVGVKALVQNSGGHILLLGMTQSGDEPAYWDLPGGRMEPGEDFLTTLRRELNEEIGLDVVLTPDNTQLVTAVLSHATIPVGNQRVPLVLIPFTVSLPDDAVIILDPNGPEQAYEWCEPAEAAQRLARKYTADFCNHVKEL